MSAAGIVGLVPAAGHSRRMGQPKLALDLGGRTVLEHVVSALLRGGADRVLVVLGPHVAFLQTLAQRAGAEPLLLPDATADMRATVERGLAWMEDHVPTMEAWLLAPADHPTLDARVVRTLLVAREAATTGSVFVPFWEGKRGHPTLIDRRHTQAIREYPPGQGLNTYFRSLGADVCEVETGSAGFADLDTPEDYRRLLVSLGADV